MSVHWVHAWCMCGGQRAAESLLPPYGLWDRTQVMKLGSNRLYPLGHVASPASKSLTPNPIAPKFPLGL